jgi:hypothetical protein
MACIEPYDVKSSAAISKLGLLADFPVFRQVVTGTHKFATATIVLRHLYKQI